METSCVSSLRYGDHVSSAMSVVQFNVMSDVRSAGLVLSIGGASVNKAVNSSKYGNTDNGAGEARWAKAGSQAARGTMGIGYGT